MQTPNVAAFITGFDLPATVLMEGIALDAPMEICYSPSLPDTPQTTLRLLWRLGFFGDANLNAAASWQRAQAAGWLQGLREALAEPLEAKLPTRLLIQELQDHIPEALTELQWRQLQSLFRRSVQPKQVVRALRAYHYGSFAGLQPMRLRRCLNRIRQFLACQAALEAHQLIEKQEVIPAIEALASAMHWLDAAPASLTLAIEQGALTLIDPHLKSANLSQTLLDCSLLRDEGDVPLIRSQAQVVLKAIRTLKHAHRLQLLADAVQGWLQALEPTTPPNWPAFAAAVRPLAVTFETIPERHAEDMEVDFLMQARAVTSGLARLLADAPEGIAQSRRLLMAQMLVKTTLPVVEWGYLSALAAFRSPSLDTIEHIARVRESLGHVLLRRFARIDHGRNLHQCMPTEVKNFSTFLLTHLTYYRQALRIANKQWKAAEAWFIRAGADPQIVDQIISASMTEQMTLERLRAFDIGPSVMDKRLKRSPGKSFRAPLATASPFDDNDEGSFARLPKTKHWPLPRMESEPL